MIATAPGKLILTGEYAVLDGAPALVIAVDRRGDRARARRARAAARRSSLAVADELAARRGAADPAARAALEIAVDSRAFYDDGATKLGLGSSAAVTVAATALALGRRPAPASIASEVLAIALRRPRRARRARAARAARAPTSPRRCTAGTIAFDARGRVEGRHASSAAAGPPASCSSRSSPARAADTAHARRARSPPRAPRDPPRSTPRSPRSPTRRARPCAALAAPAGARGHRG